MSGLGGGFRLLDSDFSIEKSTISNAEFDCSFLNKDRIGLSSYTSKYIMPKKVK